MCPFKIVYGFKPIALIDLLPLPLQERTNIEASKRAAYIKKVHEKTKEAIELKAGCKAASMNKHRKKVLEEGPAEPQAPLYGPTGDPRDLLFRPSQRAKHGSRPLLRRRTRGPRLLVALHP